MNKLLDYFENNKGNAINKWIHYFDVYERHFGKYVGTEVAILEIGVFQGGSLKMWKNYFGEKARIYAIDVYEPCKQFEEENIQIFIGSQSDKDFLTRIKVEIPKVDIIIDDGGHFMDQQIITFETLYSHLKPDGVYLCEDTHTSYWDSYGGGYKKKSSFIEYSKNFIDYLHAWHSKSEDLIVSDFTKTTHSLHYYDSIVVLEKKLMSTPQSKITGNIIIDINDFPENQPIATDAFKNENIIDVKTRTITGKFFNLLRGKFFKNILFKKKININST